MKFKLFSIALAAAAFASCSSDDLTANGTAQTQLGENEVFAYIADPDASATTRAGWAIQYTETGTIKQQAMFQTGDVFKMYKSNTWKPQMLKFKNEGTVGTINGGVFEWVDANSKYNDGTDATDMTNREYAVFPANNDYADMSFVDENRSKLKFTLANVIDYGYFTGRTSTVKDGYTIYPSIFPLFGFADENDNVKFNYMTTIIRVAVQGLAAGEHYLLLKSTDRQVAGEFLSKTDDFNAADYTSEDLPVFDTKTATTDAQKSLKVTFNIPEASAGKDQCIFLPLPTGQYNLDNLKLYLDEETVAGELPMTLTYKDSDGDYISATTAGVSATDVPAKVKENYTATGTLYKFDRGIQLLATKAAAVSYTVSELSEINEKLITLASFGRSVEATFTLSGDITVDPASASSTDRSKYLIIPELKNNVTLKFEATSDVTIDALPIKDNGTVSTAKKLTFELGDHVTMNGAITYNSKQNFVAKAATNAFKNLTIGSGAGKVEIGTGFGSDGVTVSVPENGSLTVNTAIEADVVKAITLTKAATSVEIKKGTVTTLTLPDAAQTITMTGGKIATLNPATLTAARAITLNTSGAAEIGTITNAISDKKYSYTFNATWNDDTETAGATAQQNIYTAAQLKAATSATPENYVLYADVTISMTKKPFSGVTALTKALNGNGKSDLSADATGATAHSIIGLPAPLFGTLSANVSNLNLKGVNIVGKNIKDAGALASKVNGTVALSNVNVLANGTTASVIGSAATYANTTAINVGGLVGVLDASSAAASLTISNCQVNATIRGYANLGGYVGKMVSGTTTIATINVNQKPKAPGALTFAKTLTLDVLEDMTSGTIGAMIGTVEGDKNVITIGNSTSDAFANYFTTNIVPANFSFSQNTNAAGKSFVGMPNHEIGYSTGEVTEGNLMLYGAFNEGTPAKNFTIKTADDDKVAKVNIYE